MYTCDPRSPTLTHNRVALSGRERFWGIGAKDGHVAGHPAHRSYAQLLALPAGTSELAEKGKKVDALESSINDLS